MRGLKGKTAAVTGGASGIGQAAAVRLAEEGCSVAILEALSTSSCNRVSLNLRWTILIFALLESCSKGDCHERSRLFA
ncbi:MAG: SDR family NAD(P)-dependent oxidoreductase [Methylobacteriaceae bacterium]|nr:SDR family NAD(P)-dependent oxidoreductase [Methylobacteriaceae bacterium]